MQRSSPMLTLNNPDTNILLDQQELIKMSSAMPFVFNAVELCVVIINKKPWTRARKVCKALRYEKAASGVARHHRTSENIQHKHQVAAMATVGTAVNWPRYSKKLDLYINEEGMYELLFSSQQPKERDFRRHCCNVLFPQVRRQLTEKMKKEHQQTIEEKDIKYKSWNLQMKTINKTFLGLMKRLITS